MPIGCQTDIWLLVLVGDDALVDLSGGLAVVGASFKQSTIHTLNTQQRGN